MKIYLKKPTELTAQEIETWSAIQLSQLKYRNPYFRPEFTQQVGQVRQNVEVAVIEDQSQVVGFFPFQRGRFGRGRAVGCPLSDYHGMIINPEVQWDAKELIQGCGLSTWNFDHLPASQKEFSRYQRTTSHSPVIDLSQGFEFYKAKQRSGGSSLISQTFRKLRQAERKVGDVRFEMYSTDTESLETLINWKREQDLRTHQPCAFSVDWTQQLLRNILQDRGEHFRGALSTLQIGDELAAVHFGMQSDSVLHWWFPAYATKFRKFSPGSILLLKVAEAAQENGISMIDLGKDGGDWKKSFLTGSIPLIEGSIDLRPLIRHVNYALRYTCDQIRSSPLRKIARIPWRMAARLRAKLEF